MSLITYLQIDGASYRRTLAYSPPLLPEPQNLTQVYVLLGRNSVHVGIGALILYEITVLANCLIDGDSRFIRNADTHISKGTPSHCERL